MARTRFSRETFHDNKEVADIDRSDMTNCIENSQGVFEIRDHPHFRNPPFNEWTIFNQIARELNRDVEKDKG